MLIIEIDMQVVLVHFSFNADCLSHRHWVITSVIIGYRGVVKWGEGLD